MIVTVQFLQSVMAMEIYGINPLLGHSQVEMTKVYAHLSEGHLQSAVNVL